MSSPSQRALAALTKYLAARDHSEFELREKLRRHFSQTTVREVLTYAKKQGLLPEPMVLAESLAGALHRRLKGSLYIESYLAKRGLPIVACTEEVERQKCQLLLQTKFTNGAKFNLNEKAKAYRFLKNRGFEDSTIKRALNEES